MAASSLSTPDLLRAYLSQFVNPVTGLVTPILDVPAGAVGVNPSSGNVANAAAVATMPIVAGKTNYITGFEVTGSGATAGLPVTVTVAGVLGGTQTFTYTAVAGVLLGNLPLTVEFPTPLAASGPGVAIVVTCPALGAGNTNNAVNAHGYVL